MTAEEITIGYGRSDRARCRLTSSHLDALRERAARTGRPAIHVSHGGSVANAYRYPAETEGRVEVAFPDGGAVTWLTTLPANKVTLSGVLSSCALDHRACDARYSATNRDAGWKSIVLSAIAERRIAAKRVAS